MSGFFLNYMTLKKDAFSCTNSYLNYSCKNLICIIFHLFTTACKYGVSTLQYTLQNMVEIPSKFQMDL